ncbi:MAG: tyrosine-protein phosphatase [Clostridia bacterium]|nr:tyrosine-protein phosphatase [Clostridia bacterium]
MKRNIGILFTVFITVALLFACTPKEAKRTAIQGSETITLTAQGEAYSQSYKLDLTKEDSRYTLSPLTSTSFHSTVTCNKCGIQEADGETVYCVHNTTHGGFRVELATPMKASAITSMKITYKSNVDASDSAVRIYRTDDTDLGTIQNDTALLGGAKNNWRSAFVKLDLENIADKDGYVRSFQLVMRNKNSATFHIRELILNIDPKSMCEVDITTPVQGEAGAVEAIARQIQEHFTQINCQATITVSCDTYLQNSTKYEGLITYTAKVQLSGKTIQYKSPEKTIPQVEYQWLSNDGQPYGATQDTDTNWEKDFLTSGILSLSGRKIACEEGLKKMEYAIVPRGTDYKSDDVNWFSVQQYQFNKKGVKQLFINGFLDYSEQLAEGTAYTLYVRAVTNSDNYILHIQKDFTYTPYNQTIAQALPEALEKAQAASSLWVKKGQSAKEALADLIGNKQIIIQLEEQKGYSGSTYRVQLSYADSKFKAYTGEAFTLDNVVIWNSQEIAQNAILPQSPLDGTRDIVLASERIAQYMSAPYGEIIKNNFASYINEEACTPPGVVLAWSGAADTYTVKISKNAAMTNPKTYQSTANEIEIFNLETGATYYWQVTGNGASSPVAMFTTKALPRYLKIDGVRNIRDLGGYVTASGKRIKQGLIYRSANFDSITSQGKTQLIDQIGLKTDLDLRGQSGDVATAPLGDRVQHIQVAIKWYANVFPEEDAKIVAEAFKILSKEENYPVAFHCAIGRDRTGTVAVLLLGLLGVDEETAMREYLMSMHSTAGGYTPAVHDNLYASMSAFIKGLSAYAKEGASFQKQVEGYLLKAGVTKDEIKAIRDILLEE